MHVFTNIVTFSGFLLTAEVAETAEVMIIYKRYNFSAYSHRDRFQPVGLHAGG